MAIYLLNFIDRSNIGNARAAGLGPDFGLTNNQYYSSLTLYYAVYGAANIPANYLLKFLSSRSGGSHWWLAFMTLCFGVITFAHAYIQNYGQLMAVRALLGILEGFTLPGVTYILSRYYVRRELIFRISVRERPRAPAHRRSSSWLARPHSLAASAVCSLRASCQAPMSARSLAGARSSSTRAS